MPGVKQMQTAGSPTGDGDSRRQRVGQVRLDVDLAYTTVMTVLGRLHDKGRAVREQRGRAFAYSAAVSESELAVAQMNAVLSSTTDREGALGGFVGALSHRDRAAIRRLLGGGE